MPFYRPSFLEAQEPFNMLLPTPQRALGATYLNNTARARWCHVAATSTQSGADLIVTLTKPGGRSVTVYGSGAPSSDASIADFAVPPQWSYSVNVTGGTPTLMGWVEYLSP